ncbi:MAG: HIT family protein [Acidimicrobiia bacterium]|nr:HIT family protein [Acidimicrobiia bacterium]
MASIFTRIITGDLPGRFVWRDERAVAFMSIAPLQPGHTLVVPIEEVDHWIDLDPELARHLMAVSQTIGRAVQAAFSPVKVGMMLAGLEVPHTHIHVLPIRGVHDMDFSNADTQADPASIEAAAEKIRAALRAAGASSVAG